ncbi:MAG: efflux RND transporter permease subunit, partial [Clostridia bacterium]
LGVGMLVDNSIVVMENIYRCREIGLARRDAAVEGAKQVSAALIASTLTTICVFLPVVFTDGISRRLFADIGLTIAFALLASLFMAFTLVPALSSGILRKMDKNRKNADHPVKEKYSAVLRWVLSHRLFVLLFSLLLLVFSGVFAVSRGTSFLPRADSSEMTLTVTMEEDTREEVLWQTTDEVMSLLRNIDDVKSVGAVCDNGGTISMNGVSEGNSTTVYVVLKDDKSLSCRELEDLILRQTENLGCHIDVSVGSYDLSALYEDGITITVFGDDLSTLADITSDMGELLLSVEGVENVKSSMDTATPTLRVSVNKAEAMKYGLTVSEVYDFISRSISNSANATTLSQSDTDVIVIDGGAGDLSLADIQNLKMTVTDDDGISSEVVIGSIAAISEEEGAPVIYRDNQSRYMTATADIVDGYNVGLVSDEIHELVAGYAVPEGYRVSLSGEKSLISDSLKDLLFMLGLALILMYLIMVAQFQSLLTPLIIMLTVPLAFTGGFLSLLISGSDISVIAVVGFLLLSGIVVNNGIVLVDYVNRLRKSGKTLSEALIEGCCTRMRPIVMTAATTVLAVVTLAFGLGMGAEVVQPMAIVVLGGMVWATVITLFVTPAIYDLLLRRKADTAAEHDAGDRRNDPDDEESSVRMEKREAPVDTEESDGDNEESEEVPKPGLWQRLKAKFESDDEDDDDEYDEYDEEDEEDSEEEEEEGFRARFFRRFRRDEEDEDEEDEDEDEEDEDTEKPRFRFFRRHSEDEEDDEDAFDDDDDDDEEDDEKPRFRFFRRRRGESDEADEEDDEEDDADDEEDEEDDDEVKPRRRFRFPFFRREDEEEDDDDDDEDYYGLKERRRSSTFIDEETRRRVLQIPKEDSFTGEKEATDKNEEPR